MQSFSVLKQVVHTVTTGLEILKYITIGQSLPHDRSEEWKSLTFLLLLCSFAISFFKYLIRVTL
jgi:hypothetical protein